MKKKQENPRAYRYKNIFTNSFHCEITEYNALARIVVAPNPIEHMKTKKRATKRESVAIVTTFTRQ